MGWIIWIIWIIWVIRWIIWDRPVETIFIVVFIIVTVYVYVDVVFPLKLWDAAHFEGVLKTTEVQPMVSFTVVAQTCVLQRGVSH
jgi:hypothetical protein